MTSTVLVVGALCLSLLMHRMSQNDDILSFCFRLIAGITLLEDASLSQLFIYSDTIHKGKSR